VRLVAPDAVPISDLFRNLGPIARSLHVTVLGPTDAERLPARGRQFVKELLASERTKNFNPFAIYAAQAAEVMLDAIARSDGTRASVTRELMATRVQNGILRPFRFDRNGDTTTQDVTILRPQRAGGGRTLLNVEGSTVVRVIDVPPSLLP
jgi:ABC-type branched-subunit amino acid transport system substrate-binding protein